MTDTLAWACPTCHVSIAEEAAVRRCPRCACRWHESEGVWRQEGSKEPAGFDGAAAQRLAALDEREHFWFRERTRLLERVLEERVRPRGGSALEVGCGTAPLIPFLERCFRHVTAVDGHARLLSIARRNSREATLIEADACMPPLAPARFDCILALDVIEHVDPDELLAAARRLIRPDGRLVLSAPAFPGLWSVMDERAGHRCRYRAAQLETELSRNGWELVGHTHYQFALFPALYLSRRLGGGGADSLERRPPGWLDRALGVVNRVETTLLGGLTLPWGSSIIAWARPR